MRTFFKYLYKYYLVALIPALIFSSCKKQKIDTPSFDVTADSTTVEVNQPINFTFTGTADNIAFYSGESGSEYKNKTRTTLDGKPQLQFTSYFQPGASTQTNTLSILISKDFANVYDIDNLQAAKWTDITSKAVLSTGANNTPSGVIDLSDQVSGDVPVFLAFRYTAKKDAAAAQPKWTINNFAINNVAADGESTPILTMAAANWANINVLNPANAWAFNTTALTFTGGAANADDNEDWLVSQPIQLNRAPATYSVNIKASPTTRLTTYTFAGYSTPGTYIVTFEAINANKWDEKTAVKQITITVK